VAGIDHTFTGSTALTSRSAGREGRRTEMQLVCRDFISVASGDMTVHDCLLASCFH
jgi:hypothetical protein